MKSIVIANWKLNPETLKEAQSLLKKIAPLSRKVSLCVAPPHAFIGALSKTKTPLVSQDISLYGNGAHTGEMSASQLRSVGVKYTLLGHSEKRNKGETSSDVSKKINIALRAGLTPILCIGETKRDHHGDFLSEIRTQLKESLANVTRQDVGKIIFAYEPVWAIGKEATREATPEEALEASLFIRKVLAEILGREKAFRSKIIYGGSVTYKNGKGFLTSGGFQGLLVGRQSLSFDLFKKLISSLS